MTSSSVQRMQWRWGRRGRKGRTEDAGREQVEAAMVNEVGASGWGPSAQSSSFLPSYVHFFLHSAAHPPVPAPPVRHHMRHGLHPHRGLRAGLLRHLGGEGRGRRRDGKCKLREGRDKRERMQVAGGEGEGRECKTKGRRTHVLSKLSDHEALWPLLCCALPWPQVPVKPSSPPSFIAHNQSQARFIQGLPFQV